MIIDTHEPGTCKACKAAIYWRREKSGKLNPYDPPQKCGPCHGEGAITLPGLFGEKSQPCSRCDGRGTVQFSHYATCPYAGAFRKSTKAR